MTILAIDYGTKRIGLAKGDTGSLIARPFSIIDNDNFDNILNKIIKIIEQEDIDMLLIGTPKGLSGENTSQTEYTLEFINKISVFFSNNKIKNRIIDVKAIDERLSSRQASTMISKKGHLDDVAATVFLQDYLDKK